MGFPADYWFAGNREQKVKQIGNSVEVNQARALAKEMLAA
jgi:site-specific DNA-cytosine methylase